MHGEAFLEKLFGPGGSLARALDGFEFRPQQLEMSRRILRGLVQGRHVLVEAGTGTGKTLAYLAAAVLSGRKVAVSTGTKALQEQLVHKDLVLLRPLLPRPFRAVTMKGRANYLCRNRFRAFDAFPLFDDPAEKEAYAALRAWEGRTRTGDVAELSDLDETSPLWRRLQASAETCRGSDCPDLDRCFITAMRREAVKADLLVVNHHLLFADLAVKDKGFGEVIPEYEAVILDEAHLVEDAATRHFGRQLSNYRLAELARDVRRAAGSLGSGALRPGLVEAAAAVEAKAEALFSRVASAGERFSLENAPDLGASGSALAAALERLARRIGEASAASDALASCGRRAEEIGRDLAALLAGPDPGMVHWGEVRGAGVFLHASPIDVADLLAERLFARVASAVLTSATLSAAGDFTFVKRRLGLAQADEAVLSSPFDYARQAVLYLPRLGREPGAPGFADEAAEEIRRILETSRGRGLVLFTSHRQMEAVHRRLEGRLRFPLLKQGQASREALLDRFRKDTASVLLATRSFWQGIDVQGEALSCVIVDKLPFASPGEPLVAGRIRAVKERGGNPFLEYQVPEAVLTLRQGFGRLIRRRTDRGVLSILDPRIRTRAYGRIFLASLAPVPVTGELETVSRILGRASSEAPAADAAES